MLKLKKIPIKKLDSKESAMIEGPGSYPPSFYVNDKQVPEIRDWEVGQKYQLVLEVEMKSFEDRSVADKPKEMNASASFEILAYGTDSDMENMSDADYEKMREKALSTK